MKINVLDTAMDAKGGHHFEFNLSLMRHLKAAGHELHFIGLARLKDDVAGDLGAFGTVHRHFRAKQYDRAVPVDRYAGEFDTFLRLSESFAEDLRAVDEADLWLWTSMGACDLHASALRGVEGAVVGCIHSDPGIEARSPGAMIWRSAFLAAERVGLRFTPGSIERELRHRFAPIVPGGRFALLPQPFEPRTPPVPKTQLKRIGFFGFQREEKGEGLIEPLAKTLADAGYEVVLHSSKQASQRGALPGVTALGYVEDLADPIAQCDLVVLPYSIERYGARGSGILVQCLAAGVPVVGPLGTIPGKTIEQCGVGPLFATQDAPAIFRAIKAAERNFAAHARAAFTVAAEYPKHHGGRRFAEAMLAFA